MWPLAALWKVLLPSHNVLLRTLCVPDARAVEGMEEELSLGCIDLNNDLVREDACTCVV